jgi:hypothetical protein
VPVERAPAAPTPVGTAAAPALPALLFALAAPLTATYELTDTATIRMDIAGTQVDVVAAARVASQLDLAPAAAGIRATVRVTSVEGSASNSQGSSVVVGPDDVPGPAEVTVSPAGAVDIVQKPEFPDDLQRVLSPSDLYHAFFLRLPGRDVARGAAWTDTVTITERNQGLDIETTSIVTSVWERDTVVTGRTLNVITSRIRTSAHVSGMAGGVEIAQRMEGESTAATVWDPQRRLIVERHARGAASGTTDLPAMNVSGMPTTLSASTHVWLRSPR